MIMFCRWIVNIEMRRIKKVIENPNSLFLQWLKEWHDEAEEENHNGLIKIYRMCIETLKKYRIAFILS